MAGEPRPQWLLDMGKAVRALDEAMRWQRSGSTEGLVAMLESLLHRDEILVMRIERAEKSEKALREENEALRAALVRLYGREWEKGGVQ